MRTYLLLFLLALTTAVKAQTTDVILRTNGSEVPAKVLAISPLLITYVAGPDTLALPTTEVFLIRYANGTREVLSEAPATPGSMLTAKALDKKGRIDAGRHFKTRGVFWGSYVGTLVSAPTYGLAGLGSSLILGCAKPQERNFVSPSPELLLNPTYAAGYRSRASKKKFGTAVLGFTLGMATIGVASLFMVETL